MVPMVYRCIDCDNFRYLWCGCGEGFEIAHDDINDDLIGVCVAEGRSVMIHKPSMLFGFKCINFEKKVL
jgi:hypothetical protein